MYMLISVVAYPSLVFGEEKTKRSDHAWSRDALV